MPAFGNTVEEGLKRTTIWSTYYFTVNKSYYYNLGFSEIPLLPPLPVVSMTLHQGFMGEWPSDNGKLCGRELLLRQETTKYKPGTLPLNMYQSGEQIGEKLQFDGQV